MNNLFFNSWKLYIIVFGQQPFYVKTKYYFGLFN